MLDIDVDVDCIHRCRRRR